MKMKSSPLQRRLYMLVLVCLVPLTFMIIYLLYINYRFSDRYDTIAENITIANGYMNFKESIDQSMYIIVVNMERANELLDTEQPHVMIQNAREDFGKLYNLSGNEYARSQLNSILKCLNTLEDRVDEIEADVLISGSYDENMERLDLNIRIMTELIEEQIQEYIYYETTRLEGLQQDIRSDVMFALRTSIIVFLAILLGAVFISRGIMKGIMVPIRKLSETVKQASSGDFAIRAEEESSDELEILNTSFNQMIEQIGVLVEDIRTEQSNLRQTELKVLQAQINPHFLYNTLDSIIWLVEAGKKEQAVQMVASLSNFFRTSLSKGRDYVTVLEEESHIRSYLQIQQFRYQDILNYNIHISQELYEYPILKLTLQPLVENALYHGIKNRRELGHILVTGYRDEDMLVFKVQDDGMGMTKERLSYVRDQILGGEDEQLNSSSGFGLYNVNQRLQYNYGDDFGLKIDSIYGEGTCITVTIPAVKKQTDFVK